MKQEQLTGKAAEANAREMGVRFVAGESYEVSVRGHRVLADQPPDAGGRDAAPTPTELFVASLAACVAFYAGRYLTRHRYGRDGLAVRAGFDMATTARRGERHPPDHPGAR
jgi:putative redox protein